MVGNTVGQGGSYEDTCSHCQARELWLDSIAEQHGVELRNETATRGDAIVTIAAAMNILDRTDRDPHDNNAVNAIVKSVLDMTYGKICDACVWGLTWRHLGEASDPTPIKVFRRLVWTLTTYDHRRGVMPKAEVERALDHLVDRHFESLCGRQQFVDQILQDAEGDNDNWNFVGE